MPNTYGYIRVSTKEQNEARQLDALAPYSIPEKNLYIDKQSGKSFDRPAWKKLMKRLRPRRSGRTSGSGRQKGLPQRKRGVSTAAGRKRNCLLSFGRM